METVNLPHVISLNKRATLLWNEIVRVFYAYLPRKRHRFQLRAYEDCFAGSEAVEWLWDYLKQTEAFGKNVSRQQTVLLCQKLMASKVEALCH